MNYGGWWCVLYWWMVMLLIYRFFLIIMFLFMFILVWRLCINWCKNLFIFFLDMCMWVFLLRLWYWIRGVGKGRKLIFFGVYVWNWIRWWVDRGCIVFVVINGFVCVFFKGENFFGFLRMILCVLRMWLEIFCYLLKWDLWRNCWS